MNREKEIQPYERKVQYYETDQMGIVHHSNYIRWLEEARSYYLEQIGIPYHVMEETGLLIPVLEVSCKYTIPFCYGDAFYIKLKTESFNGVRFVMSYEICSKKDDKVHTTAISSHCFVDEKRSPIRVQKTHPHIYDSIMSGVQ